MADNTAFSRIKIGNTYYYVADEFARKQITGGTKFLGVSSSAITHGGSQVPTLSSPPDGRTISAVGDLERGDIVIYGTAPTEEFIWDGSKWYSIGHEGYGSLARKNSASGNFTSNGHTHTTTVRLPKYDANNKISTGVTVGLGTLSGGTVSIPSSVATAVSAGPELVSGVSISGTNGVSAVTSFATAASMAVSFATAGTSSKLNTTSITGVSGTLTTHDTPSVTTAAPTEINTVNSFSAGTTPVTPRFVESSSTAEPYGTLEFVTGTAPSLSTNKPTVVTGKSLVTGITAGTAQTVAVAGSATTVATGSVSGTGSGATVVTGLPDKGTVPTHTHTTSSTTL